MKRTIEHILRAYDEGIPGEEAQHLMAPIGRSRTKQIDFDRVGPRLAAVLILIYPKADSPHIVLMERQKYPGVHSGQISLPGGEFEPKDKHLERTALREAHEELNIEADSLEVIGKMSDLYIPPSNYLLTPFLAYAFDRPKFKAERKEVASILEIPFESLLDGKRNLSTIQLGESNLREVPSYLHQGHIIWGATAMILSELIEMYNR